MIYNYRCSHRHCRKRVTLPRPLEWYIREPKCKACGRRQLKHDPEVARRHARETCHCNGVHFPHRRGTIIDAFEFCHALELERVSERLLIREGIEPAGPVMYVGCLYDSPSSMNRRSVRNIGGYI